MHGLGQKRAANIRLPEELHAALRRVSEATGVSQNDLHIAALVAYLLPLDKK
jgi:predicted HicB family RNase H-like nuclease